MTLSVKEQLIVDESHPVPLENKRKFQDHFTKIQASILNRYQMKQARKSYKSTKRKEKRVNMLT